MKSASSCDMIAAAQWQWVQLGSILMMAVMMAGT